jgi:CheY-like chemotaxis protein
MRVLIADDDVDTSFSYKKVLEAKGHEVVITDNGEDCLKIYHEELQRITNTTAPTEHKLPFDCVVLDYKMPAVDGVEVAKEILCVNRHQRIIFASAYVKGTLEDSINQLNQIVDLMQKPFGEQALMDTIEDNKIYSEIKKYKIDPKVIKAANLRHEQLLDILEFLRKKQNGRTF